MAETGLCNSGSSFLLVLCAVAGKRSQGSTWDCVHSSPLPSLSPSLHLQLSLLFSRPLAFQSPVIILPPSPSSLLSVLSFTFFFLPLLSLLTFFSASSLPYLSHLILLTFVSFTPAYLYLSGSWSTIYSQSQQCQPVYHCQTEAHGQYSYDGTCLYYLLSSACFAFRGTQLSKLNLVPAL